MNPFRHAGSLIKALLCCSLLNSPLAAAALVDDKVDIATLPGGYNVAVMAQPTALVLGSFFSSVEGTVTLTARNFQWGDLLSELTTNVFLQGAPSLLLTGAGSVAFNVGASQIFSTSLKLTAGGPRGYGMAGYDLAFVPKVAPVPLPAGLWLLASGVGLLVARSRKSRRPVPA